MSSNILLDPLAELTSALTAHAFGLDPASSVVPHASFPLTPEDRASVAAESRAGGVTSARVVGRARIVLLAGEGEAEVTLDRRGYTLESVHAPDGMRYPAQTYESLDALLIATSPAYVAAMSRELTKRFAAAGGGGGEGEGGAGVGAEGGDAEADAERDAERRREDEAAEAAAEGGEAWGDVKSQGLGKSGAGFR
ncbi:hypothetical protein Q5752_002360 [Cryptotrichosporon argae]